MQELSKEVMAGVQAGSSYGTLCINKALEDGAIGDHPPVAFYSGMLTALLDSMRQNMGPEEALNTINSLVAAYVAEPGGTEDLIRTRETEDFRVSYKASLGTRDEVFNKVLGFFFKHQAFCGESIMQSDNPQIEAAPLLADIADDIIQFKVGCK